MLHRYLRKVSLCQQSLFLMYEPEKQAWCRRFAAVTQMEWQLHLFRSWESGSIPKTVLATWQRNLLTLTLVIRWYDPKCGSQ